MNRSYLYYSIKLDANLLIYKLNYALCDISSTDTPMTESEENEIWQNVLTSEK